MVEIKTTTQPIISPPTHPRYEVVWGEELDQEAVYLYIESQKKPPQIYPISTVQRIAVNTTSNTATIYFNHPNGTVKTDTYLTDRITFMEFWK